MPQKLSKKMRVTVPKTGVEFGISRAKEWPILVGPAGQIVGPIRNLNAFCREENLAFSNLSLVCKGKIRKSKGWRLATEKEIPEAIRWEPQEMDWFLEDPLGRMGDPICSTKDLRERIEGTQLNTQEALRLLWGEVEEIKGWTCFVDDI